LSIFKKKIYIVPF